MSLPSPPRNLKRCRHHPKQSGRRRASVALFTWPREVDPRPICLPCLSRVLGLFQSLGWGEDLQFGLDVVEEHADAVAAVALEFQLVAATVDEQKLLTRVDELREQRSSS